MERSSGEPNAYEVWQRAQMEACAESLRPCLEEVLHLRRKGVRVISKRNRLFFTIETLRELIDAGLEEPEAGLRCSDLERLEKEKRMADDDVERAKAQCRLAEETYNDRLLEYRIAQMPESRRQDLRSLLLEERKAIQAASDSARIPGEQSSKAISTVFAIERKIKQANERGDAKMAESLIPQLETAKLERELAADLVNEIRLYHSEIRTEFAKRIQALREE